MLNEQKNVIRYKWNPRTGTGFRLCYEEQGAGRVGLGRYHVEDWTNHCVVNEWGCDSLDEALVVLRHFFELDVSEEAERVGAQFPERMQ